MNVQHLFRGRKQWRCFHCDDVFYSAKLAQEHFGSDCGSVPACQIRGYEGHLITYIRKLEDDLAQYRAEDSHIMRAMWTLEADHRRALVRAEEDGYNKGVRDMKCETVAPAVADTRRTDVAESPPRDPFSEQAPS